MPRTKKTTEEPKSGAKKAPVKAVNSAEAPKTVAKKVQKASKVEVAHETRVAAAPKVRIRKEAGIKIDVFDTAGKIVESLELPSEIFGAKINALLMAQAVRIYLANQRRGTVSTKTRGEVHGSSRKIYRQKGTGRARHGSIRAPIFVHGGRVFGPKPRDYSLILPQKMKRAALFSALSEKVKNGELKVLAGLEKITPKTKEMVAVIRNLGVADKKKKILLVMPGEVEEVKKAARNIEGVELTSANRLNTHDVLNNKTILLMKDAIGVVEQTFVK